jgi:hypothetical protein
VRSTSRAEARKKEEAEWALVFSSAARDRNDDGTSSSLTPPSASPAAGEGLCVEDDFSFGDFISSPSAIWAVPETMPPNRQT